ncbi:MAG: hydroxymethylbilane synthase, partial [Roseomonas sp.]|nr:hydroxymethylbilane synthase [Roseomonas sp.]
MSVAHPPGPAHPAPPQRGAHAPAPQRGAHTQASSRRRALPLRVGTRASPLALWQTRHFVALITRFCPVLRDAKAFEEHAIATSGDKIQDRRLADVGGKGLFAKEIHEALADGRIDFAVHSLKDLETELPPGIVLACTLAREDSRDALILGAGAGK